MNNWKNKIKRKGLGIAPQEASENIQAPELASQDKRFTGRTKQLGLSVKPEFSKQLKMIAAEEECFVIEVLEKALDCYEKHRKKENQIQPSDIEGKFSQKSKETKKQLNQFWKVNFNCDKCYRKFEKSRVYSPAPNLDELNQYPTYCENCKAEIEEPEFCSFQTETSPEPCPHFLFDKKKALCRSHNKQVWKKFNQFLKDKSVSSTAAWLTTWEQSGDWKYFWDLGEKK